MYQANLELAFELHAVKNSLTTYGIIGLNASKIESAKAFFGHIQRLNLLYVALGLSKIFEREKGRYPLCSVRGIYRLAQGVPIDAPEVAHRFTRKYSVEPTGEWTQDVEQVLTKLRPVFHRHLRVVDRIRHTRIAHLQQDPPGAVLPSIAAFEDLLGFAVDFQSFVNEAFCNTHSHPILQDGTMASSLKTALSAVGVADVVSRFPRPLADES